MSADARDEERDLDASTISTVETARGRWSPAAWSIGRPVTTLMVVAALCVLSAVAWQRIRLELLPSGFTPPFMFVQVPSLISSPQDVSEDVVRPIEDALSTMRGLDRMQSNASANSASFLLQFRDGTAMNNAYNEVRDRVDAALEDAQPDLQRYFIWKYNPSDDPLAWLGVSVPDGVHSPGLAVRRRLVPLLRRVPGVTRVDVKGLPTQMVAVDVHAEAVREIPGGLPMVVQRIQQAQATTSGGVLVQDGTQMPLRIVASIDDMQDLRTLEIAPGVALQDVAEIARVDEKKQFVYRMNGRPGIFISIYKSSDANVVETSARVRQVLQTASSSEPALEGFGFHYFFDQGELIETSLRQLQWSALIGGLLAMLCIFVFLRRVALTLLVSLSIPACLLLTIAALYFTGQSLNVLSLTGMMLSVGMLVDNAIVVVEAIDLRFKEGESARTASIRGTQEVALPVTVSTLTTLIVFLPLTFMSGSETLSFYLSHIGFPVGVGLLASLFVSLIIVPLVAMWIFGGGTQSGAQSGMSAEDGASVPVHNGWITRGVRGITAWILRRPGDAVLLIVLALFSVWIPYHQVPRLDEMEPNLNDVRIALRFEPGMTWNQKTAALTHYEDLLLDHRDDLGLRDIRAGLGDIGIGGSQLRVFIQDGGPLTRNEVIAHLRTLLPKLPGVEPEIVHGGLNMRYDNRPTISVSGPDSEVLGRLSTRVRERLSAVRGVNAVLSSLKGPGDIERTYRVDSDRAARAGVSPLLLMGAIDFAVRGRDVGEIGTHRDAIPIHVRQSGVQNADDVDAIEVRPGTGVTVDLLTDVHERPSTAGIRRVDRQTQVELSLVTRRKDVDDLMRDAQEAVSDIVLPRGYAIDEGGAFDLMKNAGKDQLFTIGLASVFVFLLVGVLFESFVLPFAVLWSVPLAFAGVFWFLFVTGTSFDVMAAVGLLVLVGVVVNTAIVLVDYARLREAQGVPTEAALLDAVVRRLRPISMTALTTIVGLVPMAVGRASIVGIPYAPLGRAVIGGLIASTILSLCVVPLFYLLLQRMRGFVSQQIGARADG